MPSPVKVIIMNMQRNIGVRCNSIQSGVTISGQMCQYQVIACQSSGVRYQVLSDNMPSTSVKYQVSGIRCQVSCIKYQCQISDIKNQVSNINISVSGN